MANAEPLEEFLARTALARLEEYAPSPTPAAGANWSSQPIPAVEFQRMKDFIRDRYQGVKPHSSYVDVGGVTIDCIPFDQQPSVRAAHAAGIEVQQVAPPPPDSRSDSPTTRDRSKRLATEPSSSLPPVTHEGPCPPGFVPLVRVSLDEIVRHGTLADYFRRSPLPRSPLTEFDSTPEGQSASGSVLGFESDNQS